MNHPPKNKKFFILRNNDLGDVLVATPLLLELRKNFPFAEIHIGVGNWAKELLLHNPSIDSIVTCNAPWHNKQNCRFPANSPKTFLEGLFYVLFSTERKGISKQNFSHGIDFLGSRQGAWLMRMCGIPYRMGVKGYAGGDNWAHSSILFDKEKHVANAGLAFIELLGKTVNTEPRPILILTEKERNEAEILWGRKKSYSKRIVIAPGGGFTEKCWGDENFNRLLQCLLNKTTHEISVIGSSDDFDRLNIVHKRVRNLCGKLTLRKSAAIVSKADLVISNTSLSMHLAGSFKVPSLILLGEWYESAKLHHRQWGYPESEILGKEKFINEHIVQVSEVLKKINVKLHVRVP